MQSVKPIVMKFGGAALADPESINRIAGLIVEKLKDNQKIIIVVSAMGKMTDQLIELSKKVNPNPPKRELDMLISVGERISMSLLAMALDRLCVTAVSFTGSQSGIITSSDHSEAVVIDVKPYRIQDCLQKGHIAIVAGFQGVSINKEITTLGRGGSDTTAVALGCALQASMIEFYKDVDGIYAKDPKKYEDAIHFEKLTYQQAEEIILKGAKVLHYPCIEMAKKYQIPLKVLSFMKEKPKLTMIS